MEFGARRTVAVLVFDQMAVFETAVPCEVFGIDRSAMGAPTYGLFLCAADPPPLRTTEGGFTIDTPHDLTALPQADTVIVPAWRDIRRGHPIICSTPCVRPTTGVLASRRSARGHSS